MTTRTLSTDPRQTALEDCEHKIQTNFRRGLEATCAIAKELIKINKEELYKAVEIKDFDTYLSTRAKIDPRSYRRIVAVAQTIQELQDAGLELPANESQAAELARLEKNKRAGAWSDLLIQSEKEERGLTVEDVKKFVEKVPVKPASGGIEVDMDDSNGNEPKSKPKPQAIQEGEIRLTEKGEAALARIRKVCGDQIANAIEDGTKAMTERDIKNWADYDDEMMKNLVYYLFDRNWPLNKAANFATKNIENSTDVGELVLIARARGGTRATFSVEGARITIELT